MKAAWPLAACLMLASPGDANAQGVVSLVCEIEESGASTGWVWRHGGSRSFEFDLRRQQRFPDGSCCFVRTATIYVLVTSDMYYIQSTIDRRDRANIDRYTGRLSGAWDRNYTRGTCRPGRRQF